MSSPAAFLCVVGCDIPSVGTVLCVCMMSSIEAGARVAFLAAPCVTLLELVWCSCLNYERLPATSPSWVCWRALSFFTDQLLERHSQTLTTLCIKGG